MSWDTDSFINPRSDLIPLQCDKCAVSKDRVVDFPSYPLIYPGRILIVNEFPSYSCLSENDPNPFHGQTWAVLNRAFYYLKLKPIDFSYTTLMRCWRNVTMKVGEEEYRTCGNYVKTQITLSQAPAIITLGSVVSKYLLPKSVTHDENGYVGLETLRLWDRTPEKSIYEVPCIPTEHPAAIQLIRCNSQVLFRALCLDIMRAIGYATTVSSDYERIAKNMSVDLYLRDYEIIRDKYNKLKIKKGNPNGTKRPSIL